MSTRRSPAACAVAAATIATSLLAAAASMAAPPAQAAPAPPLAPTPSVVPTPSLVPTSPVSAPLLGGSVVDSVGRPVSGPVSVAALPNDMDRWQSEPIVARAVADRDGRFAAQVVDADTIRRLAAEQGGVIDFEITSLVAGVDGSTFLSRRVVERAGQIALVEQAAAPGGSLRAGTPGAVPQVTMRAEVNARTRSWQEDGLIEGSTTPTGGGSGSAQGQIPGTTRPASASEPHIGGVYCTDPVVDKSQTKSVAKWIVVGELNNAYNDGTIARFEYGRSRHAETTFSVAQRVGGGQWGAGGTKTVDESGSISFAPATRRWARRLQTQFEITRTVSYAKCGGKPKAYEKVRPTAWLGGTRQEIKQSGVLDRCDVKAPTYRPGDSVSTSTNKATRWTFGGEAFGVALSTQSGYSENVKLTYAFRGSRGKLHRVCGVDGKSPIWATGRAFSGVRR